jgi:hypothetical protein
VPPDGPGRALAGLESGLFGVACVSSDVVGPIMVRCVIVSQITEAFKRRDSRDLARWPAKEQDGSVSAVCVLPGNPHDVRAGEHDGLGSRRLADHTHRG